MAAADQSRTLFVVVVVLRVAMQFAHETTDAKRWWALKSRGLVQFSIATTTTRNLIRL